MLWQSENHFREVTLAQFQHINMRLSAIERGQNLILDALSKLISMEKIEMKTLDDILADATAQTSLEASILSGVTSLNAHVADLQNQLTAAQSAQPLDQAKVDQIATALEQSNASLATIQALTANTPSAAPASAPADQGQSEQTQQ